MFLQILLIQAILLGAAHVVSQTQPELDASARTGDCNQCYRGRKRRDCLAEVDSCELAAAPTAPTARTTAATTNPAGAGTPVVPIRDPASAPNVTNTAPIARTKKSVSRMRRAGNGRRERKFRILFGDDQRGIYKPQNRSLYCTGFSNVFLRRAAQGTCELQLGNVLELTAAGLGGALADELFQNRSFGLRTMETSVIEDYPNNADYEVGSVALEQSGDDPYEPRKPKKRRFASGAVVRGGVKDSSLSPVIRFNANTAARVTIWSTNSKKVFVVKKAVRKWERDNGQTDAFVKQLWKYSVTKKAGTKYIVIAPFSAHFLRNFRSAFPV